MGPIKDTSMNGYKYFVTFIDDCSHATFIYLMCSYDEVFHIMQTLFALVENQYTIRIQTFKLDNVKEYVLYQVEEYLHNKGIIHEISCSYSPP